MGVLKEVMPVSDLTLASRPQRLFWALAAFSLIPLVILLPMASTRLGILVLAAWIAVLWIIITFIRDQVEHIALLWLACYPYGYYFLSFPASHAVFTFDRAVIGLLALYMLLHHRKQHNPLLPDIRRSAWFWGLYLIVCLGSLIGQPLGSPVYSSLHTLLDGLGPPALIGLYAMQYLPVEKNLSRLHSCACILSIGIGTLVIAELVTGQDFLPWPGAVNYLLPGVADVRRVDGPFELPAILSIISILLFFLIVYLRHLMADSISPAQTLLHWIGAPLAMFAAFAPLNRGLFLVLVPIAVIDLTSRTPLLKRRTWILTFSVVFLCLGFAKAFYPEVFEDRTTEPVNAYQRIAQDQETLRIVEEHPLFGIGLGLYHDTASQDVRYLVRWRGIESMNWPHNVPMTVLAESGLVGFSLYLLSQFFLVRAMWSMRRRHPVNWLAFLYCFLSYTLYGLDFAINYYPEVTLLYMFVTGVTYNMQIRAEEEAGESWAIEYDRHSPFTEAPGQA